MPAENRRYDLVLVLSIEAEDERRAKIVTDAEAQITGAGGEVTRNDDWHLRPLSFEIAHQDGGRVPPAAVHRPDVGARAALAQPADRRRGAALPRDPGDPGHARRRLSRRRRSSPARRPPPGRAVHRRQRRAPAPKRLTSTAPPGSAGAGCVGAQHRRVRADGAGDCSRDLVTAARFCSIFRPRRPDAVRPAHRLGYELSTSVKRGAIGHGQHQSSHHHREPDARSRAARRCPAAPRLRAARRRQRPAPRTRRPSSGRTCPTTST